jgi:hypothetical protein
MLCASLQYMRTKLLIFFIFALFECRQNNLKDWTQELTEAKLLVDFPSDNWRLNFKDEKKKVTTYKFKWGSSSDQRFNSGHVFVYILDSVNRKADIETFWLQIRPGDNYKYDERFDFTSGKLGLKKAIGYKVNNQYVINAIANGKGVQFILQASGDIDNNLDSDFLKIIKSIRTE